MKEASFRSMLENDRDAAVRLLAGWWFDRLRPILFEGDAKDWFVSYHSGGGMSTPLHTESDDTLIRFAEIVGLLDHHGVGPETEPWRPD